MKYRSRSSKDSSHLKTTWEWIFTPLPRQAFSAHSKEASSSQVKVMGAKPFTGSSRTACLSWDKCHAIIQGSQHHQLHFPRRMITATTVSHPQWCSQALTPASPHFQLSPFSPLLCASFPHTTNSLSFLLIPLPQNRLNRYFFFYEHLPVLQWFQSRSLSPGHFFVLILFTYWAQFPEAWLMAAFISWRINRAEHGPSLPEQGEEFTAITDTDFFASKIISVKRGNRKEKKGTL